MAHANEDVVRAGVEAFIRGDLDTLQGQFFADGIVWHVPGKDPLGGEYTGMEQVRDYLSRAFQLFRGTVDIELQDVLANDRHAVALFRSRAERNGRRLDTFDAVIFRVEGGKFTEVWHRSEDPYASDAFWS
jgi:ketosteroid isomerase-like protein